MKSWTIRWRILGSFAAVLGLMIVMGGIAYLELEEIDGQSNSISGDTFPGLKYSTELTSTWEDNYILTQLHAISTDRSEMDGLELRLKANLGELDARMDAYESAIHQAEDRQNFAVLRELHASYLRAQQSVLRHGTDSTAALATLRDTLNPEFEKVQSALKKLVDFNIAAVEGSIAGITGAVVAAKTWIPVSLAVAVVLAFVCGILLLRAITRPLARLVDLVDTMRTGNFSQRLKLRRSDEFGTLADGFDRMLDELTALVGQVQKSGLQVNASVSEIAATAKEQQATASEIAATTTEIGATSKEITATSKELVRTMNEVSEAAEHSATLAGSGQASLSHMEETMRHVMEAAGSINAKLAVLSEKASNINQVITTITKVADQTNLLSLNAAIEAEKAGEYGRGFAVVATEIRRLADQTAVATYDIEQTVKEIQSAVSAGVMGMDKFSEEVRRGMQEVQQVGGQLLQIIQQTRALAPRVEAVNEGMQAQATGAEQITQALTQLTEATQQTVESLRQSAQAIEDLNHVSNTMRGGISRFKLE